MSKVLLDFNKGEMPYSVENISGGANTFSTSTPLSAIGLYTSEIDGINVSELAANVENLDGRVIALENTNNVQQDVNLNVEENFLTLNNTIENLSTTVDDLTVQVNLPSQVPVGTIVGNVNGQENCNVDQQVYSIDYGATVSGAPYPLTTLTIPTSADTMFIRGVYDVNDSGFKVVLSEAPAITGYSINWAVLYNDD